VSCYDVLTRDLCIILKELLCYIHLNVSAINYKCIVLYVLFVCYYQVTYSVEFLLAPIMCLLWASFIDLK
jgi:hypothetical protein